MKNQAYSDSELFDMLRNPVQQRQGFYQLMRKYRRRVYGLVVKMVFITDDADDITQDTFIKVWEKLGDLKEPEKLGSWILKIAANESLMHLRKKKLRYFIPLQDASRELEQYIDSLDALDDNEGEKQFYKALTTLTPKQRLVFQLKYFEEKPYMEIGEIVKLKEGTLKATYHQCVKKIENYIRQNGYEG